MAIRIVTDSASDLPVKVGEQYPEVVVIPLMVVTDEGKELADGIDITTLEVCDAMRAGKVYKTSQVTPERFEEVFKSCVQNGDSVVYVGFSSELSGTVQSARLAVNMIKEEMPEADITVIDTLCASYGFGMVVQRAAELARQGVEKDTLVELVTFYAKHQQHVFSVDNLEYLRRGGRVSNVAAFFGGMLNIKPVLDVEEGKLIPVYKCRGHKKAMQKLIDMVKERSTHSDISNQVVGITHSDCMDTVEEVEAMMREQLGVTKFEVGEIGSVISCHTGPGTIAIFFVDEWPKEAAYQVVKKG